MNRPNDLVQNILRWIVQTIKENKAIKKTIIIA